MRRIITAVTVAVCALGAGAAGAGAQVSIGPALNQPPATAEGCEVAVLPALRGIVPIPPTCTLFSSNMQVPRGSWRVTAVNVRTGPRTGPMRVQIIQSLRSQAQAPGSPTVAGAICCTSPGQSQVFRLPPNSVTTVPVNIPVRNTREIIDGEPIEVVDYIGLTLLDLNSSMPAAADQSSASSLFLPALDQGGQQILSGAATLPGALPLISAVVCPDGQAGNARAQQAGACPTVPGSGLSGALPRRPATLSLPATLGQIQINQRIAVAAIRRLNAINARLAGRPAPKAAPKRSARITATTRQLRINQRISEAGYRRAKAIYDRLGGTGAAPLRSVATTIRLNRAGVGVNQLTNIRTLDMLTLIDAHLAAG